jgi:hypothetical protein
MIPVCLLACLVSPKEARRLMSLVSIRVPSIRPSVYPTPKFPRHHRQGFRSFGCSASIAELVVTVRCRKSVVGSRKSEVAVDYSCLVVSNARKSEVLEHSDV